MHSRQMIDERSNFRYIKLSFLKIRIRFNFCMPIAYLESVLKLIRDSSNILITFPEKSGADALGSALALHKTLADMGKKNAVISKNKGDKFSFLSGVDTLLHSLEQEQNFIISVSTKDTAIEKFRYAKTDESLDIFLTAKEGVLEAKDVSFKYGNFDYDLIITLDTKSLEYLGDIFSDNSSFFYTTPIINIDHSSENANFGNPNLIHLKANSVAEIVFEVICALRKESVDGAMATNLLVGIIEKTNSFKRSTVTPQAFLAASELMALGGQRELIIKNLFQNKNLHLLKILGRGLARLREEDNHIYWTALNNDDLAKSESSIQDIGEMFDELQQYAKGARAVVLFLQKNGSVFVQIKLSNTGADLRSVFAKFSAQGSEKQISFTAQNRELSDLCHEVLGMLEQILQS